MLKNLPIDIAYAHIGNPDFCTLVEALAYVAYIDETKNDNRSRLIIGRIEAREDFAENFPEVPPMQKEDEYSLETLIQEYEISKNAILLLENNTLSWRDILKICKEFDNADVWDFAVELPAFKEHFCQKKPEHISTICY